MLFVLRQIFKPLVAVVMSIVALFSSLFGTAEPPERAPEDYQNVKNVIYLIGDGMGPLHLEKTKQERNISLTMQTFDYEGRSHTRSSSDKVTDSAAGGTALACGVRTTNGCLGVFWYDPLHVESNPRSITELCAQNGMMTGVVTSDKTSGATPSSFTVHTSDRDNTEDIDNQQMESDFDLIWGAASDYVTEEKCVSNGFNYISTYSQMMSLTSGVRSFGQFGGETWRDEQVDESNPTLSQMTEKAIDLLDDTDEGFFLMVEGAHIDKHSHSNDGDSMTEALKEFDETISIALDYAKADGETLVIVTADHETGAIVLNDDGTYSYTSGSHSSADVPVFVYGSDTFIADGEEVDNYEIPERIAYSLGFT